MTYTDYQPGLHKLLTLSVAGREKLCNLQEFRKYTRKLLQFNNLVEVGFSTHVFPNNSFTAAVCLMESHICIHTWPEYGTLTLDIYLCNYLKDNSGKVRSMALEYISWFCAEVVNDTEVIR